MKTYSFLNEFILLCPKAIDNKIVQLVDNYFGIKYGIDYTDRTLLSDIMKTTDFLEIISRISKNYNIRSEIPEKIYDLAKSLDNITFGQFVYTIKEYIKYYSINKMKSNDYGLIDGKFNKTISTL